MLAGALDVPPFHKQDAESSRFLERFRMDAGIGRLQFDPHTATDFSNRKKFQLAKPEKV